MSFFSDAGDSRSFSRSNGENSKSRMSAAGTRSFVQRYIHRRMPQTLKSDLSVSDLVQSVLLLVVRNNDKFRGETREQYQGWLAKIAQRKIVDSLRQHRDRRCPQRLQQEFRRAGAAAEDSRHPPRHIVQTEQAVLLWRAIAELPDRLKVVVTARHKDEATFEQIANRLGIPATTCRRRWLKGLQILAQKLDQ